MNIRHRQRILTAAAAVCGLVLFAYSVRSAGVAEIVAGVHRIGWGLLIVLALAGLRFVLRAEAWRLCMRPDARIPFLRAFAAFVAGDAIGNLTPLGRVASEPAKVFLTRRRLATSESIASLAIDNLVYGGSALAMLATGVVVVLATVPLSFEGREAAVASLIVLAVAVFAARRLLKGTWSATRGPRPKWREPLTALRESVRGFSVDHPTRFWRAFMLDLCFHALAVFEIFLVLGWLLGDRSPTLTQAIVFEALNRLVTIAFNFVPFRVGVDEALSGAIAPVLAVNAAAGVTLAVVRKARNLFWTAVGLALAGAHGRHPATALERSDNPSAHQT